MFSIGNKVKIPLFYDKHKRYIVFFKEKNPARPLVLADVYVAELQI